MTREEIKAKVDMLLKDLYDLEGGILHSGLSDEHKKEMSKITDKAFRTLVDVNYNLKYNATYTEKF